MPELFGGAAVLDEAPVLTGNSRSLQVLERLGAVYDVLCCMT